MGQIVSVIRQCLRLCFPLPESEHQNEASQVVGIEDQIVASQVAGVQDQNEDEEAAEATAGEEDDDDVAFQANRDASVTVIARCEVDSMNDGCQWQKYEVTSPTKEDPFPPTKEDPFPLHSYVCIVDPDCPVRKYVGRCSEDMFILGTVYFGTHNHPLPVGSITAMASAASADFFRLLDSSNRLSEGTYSFTKASLPYDMNDPNDPSQGIVVDLTSQFPMPNSPVRDQDQNEPHKILVGEGSKKEDEAAEATAGEEDDHDVASHANKEARFTIIARCEEASMKDGCQWGICGVPSPTKEYPFPLHIYGCIVDPDCPVWKLVWRCSEDMSILITTYYGIHNHPLPFGSITAMASTASYDPPQFPMPKSPVRDQDQNQPPNILVGEDSKKDVESSSTTISTSFSEPHWNYDVFLSFRGEDTRKNFTDHLYSALEGVGIRTFRDNEELERGKAISNELLNAIHASRISIVVFSEGYASSSWCLDELVEIVHCKNTIGHTLLPIFYQVDPSNVRKQTGTFAEAFARHEKFEMERIQRWRKALTEAGNCSGWDLERVANGYESRFIKEIVEEVLCKVNPAHLDVAKHPIGMESRVHHIKDLLNLGTSDVRIVGIYGMGGVGKTTLAKAVYNEICIAFEGSSFLSSLKESSEKPNGLVHLQEQLLNDILKTNLKIGDVDRGIKIMEERIHGKKVLVVLDDVDDFENFHMLVKERWFHPESRIIVTTRDEHLLTQLEVHKKYKVEELNYWESLRLFSFHAFGTALPINDYKELSINAVNYAEGLPLALVVLGSFLKGRSIDEWKSKLEKLQRTPHDKIQKILRISFDSLDSSTKDIFLDVACFFIGMDKEYAIKILDECNFSPGIGISILIQRSLVTIDYQNELKMHNLIRDMGREIVCEESPKYPGKRSRLWFHMDVTNVLDNRTGSETIEGLVLNLHVLGDVRWRTEVFTTMKNLRLLKINSVHLKGSYEHLSKELKWLCWHECPLKLLPQSFHLENLVILDMQNSNVKQVWKKKKVFNKLKVLNLRNSKYLIKSPDFSQVPQLETLILEGCTSLVQVHESIGYLKRLVLLNLRKCKNLRNLPSSISNLESLKTLVLSKCFNLKKLPDYLGNMMALTELHMENTAIKQLPSSFSLLKNLETLSLRGSEYLIESPKFFQTSHLKKLILAGCISLVEVHESIGLLKRLIYLNLGGCKKLRNLPNSISNLELLKTLVLSDCLELDRLPEQLGNMKALEILLANKTAIEQQPSSLGLVRNPAIMPLLGCGVPSSSRTSPKGSKHISLFCSILELCSLTNLRRLDLSGRNLSEDEFPIEFGHLSSLNTLDLSRNNFRNLPKCISYLPELLELNLNECSTLQSISVPLIVQDFGILRANDCRSLERILISTNKSLGSLSLNNCHKLVEIQSTKSLRSGACLHMGRCNNLSPAFRESVLKMMCKADFGCSLCLPGSEIPNWFSHQTTGSSISFHVPSSWGGKFGKLLLCVVFAANKEARRDLSRVSNFNWKVRNKTRTHEIDILIASTADRCFGGCEDQIFVQATELGKKSGDEMEVSVDFQNEELNCEIQVKRCGIHLLGKKPSERDTRGDKIITRYFSSNIPIYAGHMEIPLSEVCVEENIVGESESDAYWLQVMTSSHPSAN